MRQAMKTENTKQTVRILWKGFWVAAMVLGLMVGNGFALNATSKEEAVKMIFSGADKIAKKRIRLSTAQRAAIGKLTTQTIRDKAITFYIGKKGGQSLGYAVAEAVKNRSWTMRYIVVMNSDGSVKDVEVLELEGPRGNWGVQHSSWLDRFTGMTADSDFHSINTINGAVVASRTIRAGVRKAVSAYQVIFLDKVK
jgi:H+/Na+-translocating ferredoxin:NAD+ oxidoreductase subunit G